MKQKLLTDIELDVHELKYLMDSFTKEPTPTLSELLKRSITRMQGRLEELQQEVDAVQVISPSAVEETAEEEDEVAGSEEDSPVIIQSLESVVVKEDEEGEAIVAEAQATALYLKGVKTPRPLTHDLFTTSLTILGASLIRVLIYKAKDGIFYSYIYLKKDEEIIRIDARTSDAIALAVRADCPILIYESILEQECLHMSSEERTRSEETDNDEEAEEEHDLPGATSRTLEEALEQAIKDENYELAARIRDQINSRNKNQ